MKISDIATPVVLLKMEHYGSLGIMRSLGSLGIPVYGVDASKNAVGFCSRYCRGKFIWDIEHSDPAASVRYLVGTVARLVGRRALLIPTSDETALFVADHASELGTYFSFPVQSAPLVHALCSKKQMFYLVSKHGIPTANTFFPRNRADVVRMLPRLTFPLILKGIDGGRLVRRTGRKMLIVHEPSRLLSAYDEMEDRSDPNLMIQEYIPGEDDSVWMFNGYFNSASECLIGFTGKKIRQNPVYTGMTSLGVCTVNATVAATTRRLMRLIGYQGILDIGYRYDPRTGEFKVLDINPRIGATFRLFVGTNGMDVARALYLDLTGQPVPPSEPVEGRKWFVEDKDLVSSLRYHADHKLRLRDWLVSYRGVREAGYFQWRDLRPFFKMITNHVARSFRKLARPGARPASPPLPEPVPAAVWDAHGTTSRKRYESRGTIHGRGREEASTTPPVPVTGRISGVNAVVLSYEGSAEAYDIVRALRMEGIRSIVVASERHNMAFYSRSCERKIVIPEPGGMNDQEILGRLVQLGEEFDSKPVLFYVSDPELSFVRKFRSQLNQHYRFLLPPEDTLERIFNKVMFSGFARRYQLPTPRTLTVRSAADLAGIGANIDFPCIVKPAYSQDWVWDTEELRLALGPYKKALQRFATMQELRKFCDALPVRPSGFLIQSYIDGPDDQIVSFHGYFDERSNCLGYFLGRKIRTYPPGTGGSVFVETVNDGRLAEESIACLQRVGFCGIVKIDYKWDALGKKYVMLEINPRYNLWELLGAYAGMNLAVIAYHHQRGEPIPSPGGYREHVRLLFLKQDVRAFLTGYWRTGEWSMSSYLRSLMRTTHFRMYDPGDPLPFIASAVSFGVRNMARGFRALVRRSPREDVRMPVQAYGEQFNGGGARPISPVTSRRKSVHQGGT